MSAIDSTPRPATMPVKDTRPGAAARIGVPAVAARSTPRWPGPYGEAGGSHPRTTVGRGPTGQARSPLTPPPAAPVTVPGAAVVASGRESAPVPASSSSAAHASDDGANRTAATIPASAATPARTQREMSRRRPRRLGRAEA
ncbi:hypothetical protein [Streptomyces sp. NPDC059209]|uniref:hypothetical protein n=1 Tax=Streptomyces sp. NPDC059209 TaxID=3346769 RepID=UPI0036BBD85A